MLNETVVQCGMCHERPAITKYCSDCAPKALQRDRERLALAAQLRAESAAERQDNEGQSV